MPKEILYSVGFFEIGETFYDKTGQMHTITDILLCHYMRRGTYKVLYEIDNSGEFIELKFEGLGTGNPAPSDAKEFHRNPHLKLHQNASLKLSDDSKEDGE